MADLPSILLIGTLDTKLDELLFLRDAILGHGTCQTKVLDVGRGGSIDAATADRLHQEMLHPLSEHTRELETLSRGDYVQRAIELCTPYVKDLVTKGTIHGIVSAGGSTGSSLATALMRGACPIGFPKLMVSTMASGDIKPYIEETDITMMYSVVDIAGINSILKQILVNAAGSIVGMTVASMTNNATLQKSKAKRLAVSMFGVTTPCVNAIRRLLDSSDTTVPFEVYVFHATGSGGRAMERLIDEGQIDAVIDLTTTEIADELCGGVLSAGPNRLEAAVRRGVPLLVSTGACDMVNFGPKDTVPDKYQTRNLFVHNPTVTLMRTTKEENQQIGSFIAEKLGQAADPSKVRVILPMGGVSMLDKADQPFYDGEADKALFGAIAHGLADKNIDIRSYSEHINDESFAEVLCKHLLEMMTEEQKPPRLANTRRRQWSFDHGRAINAVRRASFVEIVDA